MRLGLLIFSLVFAPGPRAFAAPEPEPRFDELRAAFKKPYLSFGTLLQIVADGQPTRTAAGQNGFSVANARLSAGGTLDRGVSYFLQGNFINAAPLLDARVSSEFLPWLGADAGAFKMPFSGEFLTAASAIDFVDRSRAVSTFGPGRSVGAQVRLSRSESPARLTAGLFNGNGVGANGNDDGDLTAVARLSGRVAGAALGAGALAGSERSVALGALVPAFRGKRTLLGADARWTRGPWHLAAELLYANLLPQGATTRHAGGYYATLGWKPAPKHQVLARYDALYADGLGSNARALVLGYNTWPTGPTEIQLNYHVPLMENARFTRHRVQVNLQVGF